MGEKLKFLKETDAWSTVLFADPIGIPLARLLSHTPVHPNVVTILSLVPALAACYFFWQGDGISLIWAALLFQFSWILDCTDGKLAKLTSKQTEFGRKLDPRIDLARKLIALVALTWGVYRELGLIWCIATGAGVIFHYLNHVVGHHIPPRFGAWDIPAVPVERRFIRRVGQLYTGYDEQFLILVIGPLLAWLHPFIPISVLWGASILYLIVVIVVKTRLYKEKKCKQ
ncbi:CDP-alcohol phosphatidyltransferase family protein [candidate division WOR-3 bacterium]|nr:CDP-alcohol phosphatidyltransferase family protein [candidate division WOR-3 bacterium]